VFTRPPTLVRRHADARHPRRQLPRAADSPSGSYDNQPVTDLTPEVYQWGMQDDRFTLVNEYGPVTYARVE